MNKSLESTLSGLIPELTGPIPKELINVADSLLVQSRHRVSNLKPEEEIARGYLCAQLACERMKKQLDLPKIQPRPPLPNKAYSLLYRQFRNALAIGGMGTSASESSKGSSIRGADAGSKNRTGKGLRSQDGAAEESGGKGVSTGKAVPITVLKCNGKVSEPGLGKEEKKEATLEKEAHIAGLDKEIVRKVHELCTHIDINAINAIPYVTYGMRILFSLYGKEQAASSSYPPTRRTHTRNGKATNSNFGDTKVNTMLTTVYIIASASLLGQPLNGSDISKTARNAFRILLGEGGTGDVDMKAVKEEMALILTSEEGIRWIATVPKGAGSVNAPASVEAAGNTIGCEVLGDQSCATEFRQPSGVRLAREQADSVLPPLQVAKKRKNEEGETGIGTMLQDRVNYISAKRIANYAEWKKGIMKKVEEIEQRRAAETD